jgi:hypothetical protein
VITSTSISTSIATVTRPSADLTLLPRRILPYSRVLEALNNGHVGVAPAQTKYIHGAKRAYSGAYYPDSPGPPAGTRELAARGLRIPRVP